MARVQTPGGGGGGALGTEAPPPQIFIFHLEQLLTCIKYWLLSVKIAIHENFSSKVFSITGQGIFAHFVHNDHQAPTL